MYSRRLRIEEKENKKKATGFVVLTIAVIAFMIFYGIPLLAKISNFAYDLKKSGETIESNDTTPPPPPHFYDLPAFTNKANIELKGSTEPAANVTIDLNGKATEVLANNDGEFSQSLSLWDGENTLFAYAKDSSGNQSQHSATYKIIFDNKAPDLSITSPADGTAFYGPKSKQITIEGITEKDAQVQINDRWVIVDSSGNFSGTFSLNDGDNTFNVKSQDQAGNTEETSITVNYTP
jgi:hypothetical protein